MFTTSLEALAFMQGLFLCHLFNFGVSSEINKLLQFAPKQLVYQGL